MFLFIGEVHTFIALSFRIHVVESSVSFLTSGMVGRSSNSTLIIEGHIPGKFDIDIKMSGRLQHENQTHFFSSSLCLPYSS